MNVTRYGLIRRSAAEALGQMNVTELEWHGYVALVIGYLFVAGVLLLGLFWIVDRLAEGWLRGKRNAEVLCDDIPDFVLCTCPTFMENTNHTAVPSIATWTRTNPKCPHHGHPAYGTPRRIEPSEQVRRGGGDKGESA